MTTLTVKAKQDFLQRVGTTRDSIKAIAEFVWNALDADASNVQVELVRNDLGGLQATRVKDDGTGITRERAVHDFESAGESWKRKKRAVQRNQGRAFDILAVWLRAFARWYGPAIVQTRH